MKVKKGYVKGDGTSTLMPAGVYDMTQLDTEISPEVEQQVSALLQKMDLRETKATFRLELFLRGGPRKTVDVRGVVAVWTNGGYLHGGGDAAVYLCPQIIEQRVCLAPIDVGTAVHDKRAICSRCRRLSKESELIGQMVFQVPTQRWSEILVRMFHELDCDADISVCVERESLRSASEQELARDRGGAVYASVAAKREWITYPLKNIIADTAHGASLQRRFQAFLEA
jgi:hypothetical protein